MNARIKICGITRLEDALAAVASGADAIGFVLWEQSARFIAPVDIRKIVESLPPFVHAVGVYVNPERAWVEESITTANLSLLQFHGDESPNSAVNSICLISRRFVSGKGWICYNAHGDMRMRVDCCWMLIGQVCRAVQARYSIGN